MAAVRWVNARGERAALIEDDILIVAPFNAQLAKLHSALPGMRVGTVDKFQGQEAPIVIHSMAASSTEELQGRRSWRAAESSAIADAIAAAYPKRAI